MLYLTAFVTLVVVSNALSRGWLRLFAYLVLLTSVWLFSAWIVIGRPTTRSVTVSTESVAWVDQRLQNGAVKRDAVSRIEQRNYRTSFGDRTGSWIVDVAGQSRVKLMPRVPAKELADALGAKLVEAQGGVAGQRELEQLLPGSGEIAFRHPLVQYVIPAGLGVAAVLLNAYA
jgi:hypothetical protein